MQNGGARGDTRFERGRARCRRAVQPGLELARSLGCRRVDRRRLHLRGHRARPDGARAQGRAELASAWPPIFADTTSRFTTEEAFAAGDRVVVRWRYDWAGGHVRGVDVIRVRDGLVAEKLAYVKG